MSIVKRIKESKLNDKKLIYIFLLLSFIFCVGVFLWDVYYYIYYTHFHNDYDYYYDIDWLQQIIQFVNVCLFCAYFFFFFDNNKKKTIFFIVALSILAIESAVLIIRYSIDFNIILIVINSVLFFCYIALIILASMGLRNKVLFFVFSIICCVIQYPNCGDVYCFSPIFLNVAVLIFGLNNYLPSVINESDYSFKDKTDKEKLIVLKEKFDNGMISEEEYKEQKKNIIDNL